MKYYDDLPDKLFVDEVKSKLKEAKEDLTKVKVDVEKIKSSTKYPYKVKRT